MKTYTAREIVDKKLLKGVDTLHRVYYLERIGLIKGHDERPYTKQRAIRYPKTEIDKLRKMKVGDV